MGFEGEKKHMLKIKKGVFLSLVIMGMLIVGGYIFKSTNLGIDNDTVTYSESINNENLDNIKIPGYGTITIPANQEDVEITLANPKGNQCYFKFDLIIGDQTIYTSNLVKEGQAIEKIHLSEGMEKGNYDLVIKITPYSLDKSSAYIGANVKAKMEVV